MNLSNPAFQWEPPDHRFRMENVAARTEAFNQIGSLLGIFQRITRVVTPSPENMNVYGSEIRDLLLLSCMECEAHWRSILRRGGITRERYTTSDYVLLAEPCRLGKGLVTFTPYRWMPPQIPFANWRLGGKPTQDIAWYDAYNATKHDRETNLNRATLQNAMDALAAVWITFVVRFGGIVLSDPAEVREYFRLANYTFGTDQP